MFATSSSLSWFIGGITDLYSWLLTVTLPVSPCSTARVALPTSAARKSDLASGGKTPRSPAPLAWGHTEHGPADTPCPAFAWASIESGPAAAAFGTLLTAA